MKIYYNKKHFKGYLGGMTETVLCMPFENKSNWPEESIHNNRFEKVFSLPPKHLQYSSIEESDFVILPYKYEDTIETQELIQEANQAGKKILVFYNDDDDTPINLHPSQGYVFRTSLNASNRMPNELPFPVFVGDFYDKSCVITDLEQQRTVGFCGQALLPIRKKVIQKLSNQDILKPNFVLRHGFWAPGMSREKAREEFIGNMKNNLFNVCIRGDGNFSYRFYETLMMGRIPLVINTNQVFPFEHILNYEDFCIIIQENDLSNFEAIIIEWLNKKQNQLVKIQINNRKIWENYMSPTGWINEFKHEINKNMDTTTKTKLRVNYLDLGKQWDIIKNNVTPFIQGFLSGGNYLNGGEVELFEYNFCNYAEVEYAVGCSSGTDALKLALQALNLKGSTHVVIPANSHISEALAVKQQKGPWSFELIDHDEYYQIDVELLKNYISKNRDKYDNLVILPVHMYGHAADMENIMKVAKAYDCLVIEDASQAHGAFTSEGKMVGQYGEMCVYSCNPERNLSAAGNAAIITTNSKKHNKRLRALRNLGSEKQHEHNIDGWNHRLDGIQAIILSEKLKYLNFFNRKRQEIAAIYNEELKEIPYIKIPLTASYSHTPVYNVYCIQAHNRDKLQAYLKEQGITTIIHYPNPIKSVKCNENVKLKNYCPNTYMNKSAILSLPIHPLLTQDMVYHVTQSIKDFYKKL